MDTSILQSLNRLETSLTSLAESITSYAPNLSIAQNLLAADAELTESLNTLATHTSNTILLAHLHSLADNLAATYKRQIEGLAEVRREILNANIQAPDARAENPNGDLDGERNVKSTGKAKSNQLQAVDYKTVLAFARNLSRYSAPRGFKPPSVIQAENEARQRKSELENNPPTISNGTAGTSGRRRDSLAAVSTGGANTDGVDITMADASEINYNKDQDPTTAITTNDAETANTNAIVDSSNGNANARNPGLESLDQGIKAWLDPQLQEPFVPWPSDEMIARSGLARAVGWIGAVPVDDEGVMAMAAGADAREEGKGDGKGDGGGGGQQQQQQQQGREQRPREVERPKIYHGLDLYDPDEE